MRRDDVYPPWLEPLGNVDRIEAPSGREVRKEMANAKHVIGARWIVTAHSAEAAERIISRMLEEILGERVAESGYVGTYQSADSPEDALRLAKEKAAR